MTPTVSKFTKCYLHIGTEKTGTTSLQQFLKINQDELKKQGFFVSEQMGPSEHIDLVCLFAHTNKRFSRRKRLGMTTPAAVEAHKVDLAERIGTELANNAHPDRSLIISSERLVTMINTEDEIAALREFLLRYCDEVEIVAYIRPQHEFAISRYSTVLKTGSESEQCLPVVDESAPAARVYYYDQLLGFWHAGFPESPVTIRKFQRNELVDGDTVEDFAHISGIDTSDLQPPRTLNKSLSAQAQLFLRHINSNIPKPNSPAGTPRRGDINSILEQHFSGPGYLPNRHAAQAFYDQFSASNECTRATWFPDDERLFEVSFDKYPDDEHELELSLDDAFEMFAKIYEIQNRRLAKLRERVAIAEEGN